MKKITLKVGVILAVAACFPLQSCIGSFALTNKVLSWNRQVSSKFVNELVFFAFWVIPVYEVTSLADLVVLNSIEFWSGNNPVEASMKSVETDYGKYYIACDGKGYDITAPDGNKTRLDFDVDSQTWSAASGGEESVPFMTMVDDSHVRMITPQGEFTTVELSSDGVMAYCKATGTSTLALNR